MDERGRRRVLWIELGAVLCLSWLPSLITSLIALLGSTRPSLYTYIRTPAGCWQLFVRDFSLSIPAIFIIWGSGEPLSRFGLSSGTKWAGFSIVPSFIAQRILVYISLIAWDFRMKDVPDLMAVLFFTGTSRGLPPTGHLVALASATIMTGFYEELIYRGYLITRLTDLLGKQWLAVVLSSVLFGAAHLYQGVAGAVTIGLSGLIFAIQFVRTKSVFPSALVHGFWDFMEFFRYLRLFSY